jgi:hypothetical protein
MANRCVTHVHRNRSGPILAICNPAEKWSREKKDAIADIEQGKNRYYALFGDSKADIQVVQAPYGKYLRTVADRTTSDNLGSLPGC